MKKLKKDFFLQSAEDAAAALIGKWICRNIDGNVERFQITETECYIAECDSACHGHKGKTERTQIMWCEGGVCYVYLCYGMHFMLNFVTGKEGDAQCVLIRGVSGAKGPGRASKAMHIDKSFYGESLIASDKIWVEDDHKKYSYTVGKRIGINYAKQEDIDRLWRFEISE